MCDGSIRVTAVLEYSNLWNLGAWSQIYCEVNFKQVSNIPHIKAQTRAVFDAR